MNFSGKISPLFNLCLSVGLLQGSVDYFETCMKKLKGHAEDN